MKLEAAWLVPYDLPLKAPLATAHGTLARRQGAVLVVADDSGAMGLGDVAPLPTHRADALDLALGTVRDAWSELRERDPRTAWRDLPAMPSAAARSAVVFALADLIATRARVPIARLLASDAASSVPVNALVRDAGEAAAAVAAGFSTVKAKCPRAAGAPALARALAATGARVRLDANGGWTREEAERLDLDVEYVEQPLPPAEAAPLRARYRVAADESASSLTDARAVVQGRRADVVVLKPSLLGGPDFALAVAEEARKAGLGVVVTTALESVVGRLGALHVAAAIPGVLACGLDTGRLMAADVAADPSPPARGAQALPDAAGLGLRLSPGGGATRL